MSRYGCVRPTGGISTVAWYAGVLITFTGANGGMDGRKRPGTAATRHGDWQSGDVNVSSISEALIALLGQMYVIESVVTPGSANVMTQLVRANPLRWGVVISAPLNTSNGLPVPSWIRTVQSVGATFAGIPLGQGNGWKEFDFRDFGVLVQQDWYGAVQNVVGVGSWHIIEVLIQQ